MEKKSRKIICFSICLLIVCSSYISPKAEALPNVMSGSTTLADNIMTYYALSGNAIANSEWINTLYSSYGSNFGTIEELANQGYLVLNDAGAWEPVQELGEMIEQAPAYASLKLNEMFNVSAEEVATGGGLAVASGGSILAGSLGGVASTGVVPLLGGVTVAYWGGIGLGTLAAHALGLYGKSVTNGQPVTMSKFNSLIPAGASVTQNDSYYYYSTVSSFKMWYVKESGVASPDGIWRFGYDTSRSYAQIPYTRIQKSNGNTGTGNWNLSQYTYMSQAYSLYAPYIYIPSGSSGDYRNKFKENQQSNSDIPIMFSPDSIGQHGNNTGSYDPDTKKYDIPDYKPMIDTQTQAGKPLTLQDWQQFANGVNNNNSGTDPFGENAGLYEAIMKLIVDGYGNTDPDPDPDPWSPPVVTPVPDPSYPDPVPDQQITENPQESENPQQTEPLDPTDTGKPWRLPDLREKFPFCIPWDIAKVFSKLKVNVRQAPHISWRFNPPNTPIDYTFNLDLEDFEPVATLLRTLELMGFIVGLAFITRYLIGAN